VLVCAKRFYSLTQLFPVLGNVRNLTKPIKTGLREIDINPVRVNGDGATALDALIVT